MSDHPNVALMRSLYDAFAARDVDALGALLASCIWHIPGENVIAGTYNGGEEIKWLFAKARGLTDDTLTFTVHDVVGEGEHVVGLDRVTAMRSDGRTIDQNRIVIGHVRDGALTEVWLNVEDQYAFDEFWA